MKKKKYRLKNWVAVTIFYTEIIVITLILINNAK